MKQLGSISELVKIIQDPECGGFSVKGVHPDLLSSIIKNINQQVLVLVTDDSFDSIVKYMSSYTENSCAVFLPADNGLKSSPSGFSTAEGYHLKRAKELLAGGINNISLIISTHSGANLPIASLGIKDSLSVSEACSFEDCYSFLKKEGYVSSDFVSGPGEYSLRGGIIDVFLYSREHPCRINFLDEAPIINNFNVETQLAGAPIDRLEMVSVSKQKSCSINDIDLSSFLRLSLSENWVLKNKYICSSSPEYFLKTIDFNSFKNLQNIFSTVETISSLDFVGFTFKKTATVPAWFIKKESTFDMEPSKASPISLSNISVGDFLVHRDHGVCVFLGLVQKESGGENQEFVSVKFSDGAKVLINSTRLDLITFYAPFNKEGVRLDSLSKKGVWLRKKASAKAQAEETISSLLNLYVKRSDLKRDPYIRDFDFEKNFISSFPYNDTIDQVSAWKEISEDLEASRPMDRLLCGDVGFGKTELAIRAAFRVVLSKKRVVVLSPTTILANQLYSSFLNRVKNFGVDVDMVSRFRSKKDVLFIKSSIEKGLNDILIGTHALLNDDIYLKNIGLVVIDEEHRFGVKQKEKIKEFKGGVDVLSMSATPIPRSMNMAISKIYSISTLQSPPKLRLPIKTRVEYYNFKTIQEAISFEINRGGQVYFVHNDIASIKSLTALVSSWFETSVVEFIHGQEPPGIIEKKMVSFVGGKIDVLICTTIIESGIDVPNANCIIINNSHIFGLAQLYQMRGRVGRGLHQAYAYLLIPRGLSLSEKSFRRIKSIEQNISLGSGFNVSMADMEIRGSGSLFGYKQSGGAGSLGYEMYTKMIQRSLHETGRLNTDFKLLPEDVIVSVYKGRIIPEEYVSIENIRISIYKSISVATKEAELDNIVFNLEDRFGPVPNNTIKLIKEQKLRLVASRIGINSITTGSCGICFSISDLDNNEYIKSFINYVFIFFNKHKYNYHVLPTAGPVFSVCIHLDKNEDIYTFFLRFLGKFSTVNQ